MFHCNLHWMPRYCLVAKNFWLALSELATAHEPRQDVFGIHFLYCLVMTWKTILSDFSAQVLNSKEFKCGEDPRCKDATYAIAESKPDKNETFRLAGIRTLTSAIPVQCSNQYVLYCRWTVSNISRITCILTLPPHIYSVRIQNTFSKIRVVYIKRYAYQSELWICKVF